MAKLGDILNGYKKSMESGLQRSAQAMTEPVVYDTPVDTFSAMNSWEPNKGAPVGNNATYERGQAGPPNRSKFLAVTSSLKIGDIYSLANGKDYIRPLEHGYSNQAPAGMMHRNIARWPQIARESFRGS